MLTKGESLHGFMVEAVEEVPEFQGYGIRCLHKATGLEVFHVLNNDPENFFSFNFLTVPKNSKGTAHIVEHSVLSGSQRYPVKDPFVEIMKGSAQTFLNAMTYPDRTIYPGASPIKKDFYNLMKVYGDAVFFPLLRKETFQQEGIRVSMDQGKNLDYQGIVFNEMLGSYSAHDSIVAEESIRQLFPDTPMHYDSGGDPRSIVDLTYEEFKGFHAEHYHPSNCKVFFYGSIPTEELLTFLQNEFLADFTAIQVDKELPRPKRWRRPKTVHASSPAGPEEESDEQNSSITMNWLTKPSGDPIMIAAYEVLTELLLGNPGAPMYQAIIDSEIGEDIAPLSGMEGDTHEMVFTIGIRGTRADRKEQFEKLVLKTLNGFVKKGIPEQRILSALKKIEFQQKEIKGGMPQGLRCLVRTLRGWMYGQDPVTSLRLLPALEQVKSLWEKDKNYFSKIIKEDLFDNPHRLTVVVSPDEQHQQNFVETFQKKLHKVKASLTNDTMERLRMNQNNLEQFHEQADEPKELQKIPRLKLEDLPEEIRTIDTQVEYIGSTPFVLHRYHTNGICYVDYFFDAGGLSEKQIMLLPLLSRLLYTTSMEEMNYAEVSSRLSECTGGFYSMLDAASPLRPEGSSPREFLVFRAKFLEEDMDKALSFIHRLFLNTNLHDERRIRDIIAEGRNDFSISLQPSGSSFASLKCSSKLSAVQQRDNMWKGIDQLLFLHTLDAAKPKALHDIGTELERMRQLLIAKNRCMVNITASEAAAASVKRAVHGYLDALPEGAVPETIIMQPSPYRRWEGIITASQVAFCAHAITSGAPGSVEQLHQSILASVLSSDYLYEHIRLRGGAYGVGASVNLLEGVVAFASYRDPAISKTYSAFQQGLHSIAQHGINDAVLEQVIISAVAREVRPLSPSEKGLVGFRRWMYGIGDDLRAERRRELLRTTPENVQAAAQQLAEEFSSGCSSVIAGKSLLERESKFIPELLENPTVLPL